MSRLIFHEAGHAFHTFESRGLPYIHQRKESMLPAEFAEVASISMEFIGACICSLPGSAQRRKRSTSAFSSWNRRHGRNASSPAMIIRAMPSCTGV